VFIFAFLFIAAIFFVRGEILSKRAKIIATALIVLLCTGAYLYESASERSAKLEEEMVFKFNAGARLRCGSAINFTSETRGAADSFSEKHSADAKNLGVQAGEVNLNAQDRAASAAQTNEQASAAQINGAVSGGQNSAQSPTSQNSTQQNDTQNRMQQNSASQGSTRSSASQNSAQRGNTQISDPQGSAQNFNAAEQNSMQGSAQNSKTTQNSAPQSLNLQSSAQIVTRESFTYSFSLGAFIAKKSAGAEFKGKTYKIKECVYDQ